MKYIRTHIVEAEPMTRGDYHKSRGWAEKGWNMPEGATPEDPGYKVVYKDRYVSWCPKGSFEEAGRPIDGMTFGQAIEAMKQGKKVARRGWNGKGMYVFLADEGGDFHTKAEIGPERRACVHPFIVMYTAQGDFQPGWLASQNDMLSDDWTLVD